MKKYNITYNGKGTPKEGDLTTGKIIGKYPSTVFIYRICPDCKEEKWVEKKANSKRCIRCAGALNKYRRGEKGANWKGGRFIASDGYITLTITPDDPYFKMSCDGTIKEHRYIMAKKLGRNLESWEHVHHKNGKRDDNREENLELMPSYAHSSTTRMQREIRRLQKVLKDHNLQEYI